MLYCGFIKSVTEFGSMFNVTKYFESKVTSIAFQTATLPATVEVMAPGEYEFGTNQRETKSVVIGTLTLLFPEQSDW